MRISRYLFVALLVALVGCAEDTKAGGGGNKNNNGGGAGTTAGAGAGTTGGFAGISGGEQIFSGSGGSAGTGGVLTDGGVCEEGKVCVPLEADPTNCGTLELTGDVKTVTTPGNVLIVFDRSGSMTNEWNGMQRWQAAGGAMVGALTPLQDTLTIGAVFFPSDQGLLSCVVDPISNPTTQIAFQPGATALTKMQTGGAGGIPMYQPGLGSTPTMPALRQADAAFNSATLSGTTVAILVTDGDPTCMGADAWDQTMAINIVSGWAAKGIKTYVLGVPGVGGTGEATLNAVAVAGGTAMYISPSDPATLGMKMREIVESTVSKGIDSCEINFDMPTAVPDKLTLAVTSKGVEQAVPHVYPDGTPAWEITPDGTKATLLGDTCEAAKKGVYEKLRFVFGCEELPPAPPPEVPE